MTILAQTRPGPQAPILPIVSVRTAAMPLKTNIIKKVLTVKKVVDPAPVAAVTPGHCDPENARLVARYPGVDCFLPAGPGRIECYSATSEKDVRHFHLLRFDCRVTVPGRPCQFFVSQCSACRGFQSGGCRHASTLTGLYNHLLLHGGFRQGWQLLLAVPSHRQCPQCPPPGRGEVTVWHVLVQEPGAIVTREVCAGLRGGTACEWGIVA